MEKIKKFHPGIRSNMRYKLCSKMMQEYFLQWLSQPSATKLLKQLFEDCKKNSVTLSAPNPLFLNNIKNSLTNSQIAAAHFIPPVSPNSLPGQSLQLEKKNSTTESQINNDKKTNESLNSMMSSMSLSKIPKFYFPSVGGDIIHQEDTLIDEFFKNSNKITIEPFMTITKEFYNLPGLLNRVLFNKIDTENKGFITKDQFMKYHIQNFRGCSITERFFNFLKSPDRKYIIRDDFKPILRALLDMNPSLEFLKEHLPYQKKYTNTVIMRIFYANDPNDDGKLTLHDFKRSDLIEVIKQVCDDDINNVRQYFSYEHFYVIYCTFFELDSTREPEKELFISKESFSRYDGHSLGRKAVDRIFNEIPRKFVSTEKDMMCFEDFLWYILSEEDKTNPTSIKYWFKVVDLDDNGIITPSEMEYFYQEQIERLESNQNEIIQFNDVLCQLYDMIPPEKEYQWTLQNFLDHPQSASIAFNALLNYNKFIENEQKDPFLMTEIEKRTDFTDWDKFAYREYLIKMNEENGDDDPDEEEPVIDDD
jgi:serine/threonine-protein phosphatase 2A regulatory subunit B''